MKVKTIRPMEVVNPHFDQAKYEHALRTGEYYAERPTGWVEEGFTIEHQDAYKLVAMGIAVPADSACENRLKMAGFTESDFDKMKVEYNRVAKGIQPEDYDDFDAKRMNGYDEDGRPTLNGQVVKLPPKLKKKRGNRDGFRS